MFEDKSKLCMPSGIDCASCVKNRMHCCEALVPFTYYEVAFLEEKAKELGIKDIVISHSTRIKGHYNINTKEQLENLTSGSNCIFLNEDGLCRIYEDRPTLCRLYGTEKYPCDGFLAEEYRNDDKPLPMKRPFKF